MKKLISYLVALFFITLSCSDDKEGPNIPADFKDEIFDEMLAKGLIEESNKNTFVNNIEESNRNLSISKSYAYDNATDVTKTTISISSKIGFISNVSIIEYIPKEVASSVQNMNFSKTPSEIINEDPKIMWHLMGLGDKKVEISYGVTGNHVTTGTTYVLSENNYDNCLIDFIPTYSLWSETFDLDEAFLLEYGSKGTQYVLADWNQLKETDLNRLVECMFIKHDQTYLIKRNGERFYNGGNRHYYIHYSTDGVPYSGFAVHDRIGNFYLGSWYGLNMYAIGVKSN